MAWCTGRIEAGNEKPVNLGPNLTFKFAYPQAISALETDVDAGVHYSRSVLPLP